MTIREAITKVIHKASKSPCKFTSPIEPWTMSTTPAIAPIHPSITLAVMRSLIQTQASRDAMRGAAA